MSENRNKERKSDLVGTSLWLSRSKSGKGLTLRVTERRIMPVAEMLRDREDVYLHVPVSQVEKLIRGDVKGVQFAVAEYDGGG